MPRLNNVAYIFIMGERDELIVSLCNFGGVDHEINNLIFF